MEQYEHVGFSYRENCLHHTRTKKIKGKRIFRTNLIANFSAKILSEEIYDDGKQPKRYLRISGMLWNCDELPVISVPVEDFSSLTWIIEKWGIRPVINVGCRGLVRQAIHESSEKALENNWAYSTAGWMQVEKAK